MASLHRPAEIITLLQDIERRNQQGAAGLSQKDHPEGAWSAIGFRIGKHHMLIPLDHAREMFPVPEEITRVPKSQPWIFGIANLRGDLLPIVDLQHFLMDKPGKLDKRSRILVLNHPEYFTGLLVDEVFGLKHYGRQPETHDPTQHLNLTPYLTGSVFQQGTQWLVMSFQKLAEDPRFINAAA
ncbi:MAG: chemotaxis protein CheW [Methylophaga sp.]|nr:chemotaxis protein CheW [Methylophaga sp.]